MRPRLCPAALIPRAAPASRPAAPAARAAQHAAPACAHGTASPLSFLYPPACHGLLRCAARSGSSSSSSSGGGSSSSGGSGGGGSSSSGSALAARAASEADVHAHDEHAAAAARRRRSGASSFFTRFAPPHRVDEAPARQHGVEVAEGAQGWQDTGAAPEGKAPGRQIGDVPQHREAHVAHQTAQAAHHQEAEALDHGAQDVDQERQAAEEQLGLRVHAELRQSNPVQAARILLRYDRAATARARQSIHDGLPAEAQSRAIVLLHSAVLSAISAQIKLSGKRERKSWKTAASLFESGHASAFAESHYMRSLLAQGESRAAVQVLRAMLARGHVSRVLLRDVRAARRSMKHHDEAIMTLGQLCVEGWLPLEVEKAHIPRDSATSVGWIMRSVARLCSSSNQGTSTAARQLLSDYIERIPSEPVGGPTGPDDSVSQTAPLPDVYTVNTVVHHLLQKGQPHQAALGLLQRYMAHRGALDNVSISILLRRATVMGDARLANAALLLDARATTRRRLLAKGRTDLAERDGAQLDLQSSVFFGSQLRDAIRRGDSWRLAALLAHAAATGRFRGAEAPPRRAAAAQIGSPTLPAQRRSRSAPPPPKLAHQIVRVMYPSLHKFSLSARRRRKRLAHLRNSGRDETALAPRRWDPPCVLEPHVMSAALNLCAKAGRTGLAERVWRLLCESVGVAAGTVGPRSVASAESAKAKAPSVAKYVPLEAATSILQVYAGEARKGLSPTLQHATRRHSTQRVLRGPVRRQIIARLALQRSKSWARGWTGRSRGFALPRWLAARISAASVYRQLRSHWRIEQHAKAEPATVGKEEPLPPRPDARLFDVLLGIFGRRPGVPRGSPRHRGSFHGRGLRASMLMPLCADADPLAPSSWQDVLDDDTQQVALWHSAVSSGTLHPIILLVLADMALLGIPVPPAYVELMGDGQDLAASKRHRGGAWRIDVRLRTREESERKARAAPKGTERTAHAHANTS